MNKCNVFRNCQDTLEGDNSSIMITVDLNEFEKDTRLGIKNIYEKIGCENTGLNFDALSDVLSDKDFWGESKKNKRIRICLVNRYLHSNEINTYVRESLLNTLIEATSYDNIEVILN